MVKHSSPTTQACGFQGQDNCSKVCFVLHNLRGYPSYFAIGLGLSPWWIIYSRTAGGLIQQELSLERVPMSPMSRVSFSFPRIGGRLLVLLQPMKEGPPLPVKCKDKSQVRSTITTLEKDQLGADLVSSPLDQYSIKFAYF
jgi:hypothetical protein